MSHFKRQADQEQDETTLHPQGQHGYACGWVTVGPFVLEIKHETDGDLQLNVYPNHPQAAEALAYLTIPERLALSYIAEKEQSK